MFNAAIEPSLMAISSRGLSPAIQAMVHNSTSPAATHNIWSRHVDLCRRPKMALVDQLLLDSLFNNMMAVLC